MVAVPPAIIFVNNDLTDQVKNWIIKQLHIDFTMTGDEFDDAIAADSQYANKIRSLGNRLLVIRDFRELENRTEADVAIFVKSGLAAIEQNKFGPPQQTFKVQTLNWGHLNVYQANISIPETTTQPVLTSAIIQSATVSLDGLTITLLYNMELNTDFVPDVGDYSLSNTLADINSVEISGSTVLLELTIPIQKNIEITINYTANAFPVQNLAGKLASSFINYTVINNSEYDEVAPIIESATILSDGLSLILAYDEILDTESVPTTSDFSIIGASVTVSLVNIEDNTIVLTLTPAIQSGEVVSLNYTSSENPVQDFSGNNAEDLVNYSVVNNSTVDIVSPVIESATVPINGLSIILEYNENLDTGSIPAVEDFSITGTSATVSDIEIIDNTVIINLAGTIQANEDVLISYTSGANPIQDVSGNIVNNLINFEVINNSTQDTIVPVIQSAVIPLAGTTLTLTYNEDLNTSSTPSAGSFSISGTSATISSVNVLNSTVTLNFSGIVQAGEIIIINYTAGVNPVQDVAGNNAANLINYSVTNNSTANTSPPVIESAVIPLNGLSIILTYDELLNQLSVPGPADYSLSGTSVEIDSVDVDGDTVILELAEAINAGVEVTLDYTPGANPVRDVNNNNAAALSDYEVTNNSTADTVIPVIESATVSANGLSLTLVYSEDLNTGSVPSAGDYSLTNTLATVSSVSILGDTVTLTIVGPVQIGQSVLVSYTAGVNPVEDLAGNNASSLTNYAVTNNSTQDTIAPILQSSTIPSAGTTLVLTYNENLDTGSTPLAGAFSLSGTSATVASVGILGTSVTLTLSGIVQAGQTVAVSYTAGASPIQDVAGNDAANLTNQAVTNNSTQDTIAPVLQTATISANGLSLALVYNENLDTGSTPSTGAFSLSGTSATISLVNISSNTVTLTLVGPVQIGQTVTLNYTAGASPIQDAAGNDAANLSNQAVINNSTQDTIAPVLQTAVIPSAGSTLVLTYNENLDTGSTPLAGAFSLSGTSATVSSASVLGTNVTLTLSGTVQVGQTVTLNYTAGGTPIQDTVGNDAANLTNQAVTNNSTQDTIAPTLQSATVPSAGTTLVLTYNENLDTGSTPLTGAFSLSGTSATVASVNISGTNVTLTLSGTVQIGQTVTLNYTAGASPIQDAAGNDAANLTNQAVTNNSTQDTVAPVLQTAVVPSAGSTLVLTYNENLDTGSTPLAGAFSLSGTSATVASVNISSSTVTLTLSGTVQAGQTVTLNYTAGASPIQDAAGNDAANLTNQAVTNNSTQDTVAPVLQTAAIPSAGTTLVLTYNENLNTGSTPVAGDYSLSGTSATVASVNISSTTVTLTLSGTVQIGQTVTVSYTAGSNPVEDVAGNNAANLTNQAVTNNSTQDTVAPTLQSAVVPSAGSTLVLTYNENLNESSTPSIGAFSLSGTTAIVASVVVDDTTVTLTLTGLVVSGETVTISYTAGASPIEDIAGNDAANLSSQAVTNNSTIVLAFAFDTFLSAGTHTDHLVRQSIVFDGFGAGGGAARAAGDVGQSASGGGGEHSRVTKTTAEASYTISIGAGGSNGVDAGAQDGGDTTVSDSGGVILRAKGGLKGIAANPTGTAGAGGTGGVGDSLHAGGSGAAGSAGTNGAGGASGGSSTAGSTVTPGDPEGSSANNSNNNAARGAGGARRANAVGRSGGSGWVTSYYVRSANLGYPYIVPNGLYPWRDAASGTSRGLTVPGTHVSGDRLIVIAGIDGAGGASSMSGLTEMVDLADSGGNAALGVWALDATGSDTLTLATANELTCGFVLRIRNAKSVSNWDLTGAQINTGQLDPPSHTHAAGSKPILWIAAASWDGANPENISALPSGWDRRLIIRPRAYANTSPGIVISMRLETAATVNPAAWTSNNQVGYTATIAVPLIGS